MSLKNAFLTSALVTTLTLSLSSGFCAPKDKTIELANSNNAFAVSLYSTLKKDTADSNFVFSPYSLSSCLYMPYLGARSQTATEMQETLSLKLKGKEIVLPYEQLSKRLVSEGAVEDSSDASSSSDSVKGYEFYVANSLWVDLEAFILADYRHTLEDNFGAKMQTIDFGKPDAATEMINGWVSSKTKGKIPALLQEQDIDESTKMLLANAAYFKGAFIQPFAEKRTHEAAFFSNPTVATPVLTMQQTARLPYFENETFQMLAHPLMKGEKDTAMAFFVILPKAKDGLGSLEATLSATSFQDWMGELEDSRLEVSLPKFTLTQRLDLGSTLSKMGMPLAFTPKADFSGIDGLRDLYLNKAVHETYFSLDEKGVTAAAATAVSINVTSSMESKKPIVFKADHPFLFGICDLKTKTVLFLGKLSNVSK